MEGLLLKEVINAVNGTATNLVSDLVMHNISIDSRKTEKGDLYIALEGEKFDGHDFVKDAITNGATAIIVSKPLQDHYQVPIIQVEDTLKALWSLATFYREKLRKPVIAITGSVGKTSTKDMIGTILSAKYHVHKSQGNFNNHIGMPLTILGLGKNHDVAVVEMGMRGLGEIRGLTQIAKPNIAVITNIGISHIERLGSKENILRAKLEIAEGLSKDGVLILNANDPFLSQVDQKLAHKIVYIGVEIEANYSAYSVKDHSENGVSFKVDIKGIPYDIHTPAIGTHNVYNVLFGIACGLELGMGIEEILNGIKNYQPEKMRLNIIEKNGIKFIDDSYNASPDSMKAGLQVLKSLAKTKRSIAVLGDMFELGKEAINAHYEVGKVCRELGIDFVAIMGENAKYVARGIGDESKYKIFKTHKEIADFLKENLHKEDVVLLKGSRGMNMEKILELFTLG